MINKRGSISLLAIYLCSFILLNTILIKSLFLESYYFYSTQEEDAKLFLIESLIIRNVYNSYRKIEYNNDNFNYKGAIKKTDNNSDIHISVSLFYNKKKYDYEIIYDNICHRVIAFNNITKKNIT